MKRHSRNREPFAPIIVIPCYNHGMFVEDLVNNLQVYELPIIIINDGSDEETTTILENLAGKTEELILITQPTNQGKGNAVMRGMKEASKRFYTHALQVDADGQHDITDIPKFIEKAKKNPHDLISGKPLYDASIPKSRLYSRYITHFWVWIETLSLTIKDSMCGFRIYPLKETLQLAEKSHFGSYMDFDTEIMVKLYWEGATVQFIDTRVIYPVDGVSHFRMLKDNLLITWMHTRLFFGMLIRIPRLIARHYDRSRKA